MTGAKGKPNVAHTKHGVNLNSMVRHLQWSALSNATRRWIYKS